jgi:methylglutaconyl-CoA hydratase
MLAELTQAFGDLHLERRVRAVILTGSGQAFSAGIDLREIQATSSSDDALAQWHADVVQYKGLLETMLQFPKPIIAAVNGPAAGAGAGLVLASDIVLAAHEAQFGFPEPHRGLVSGVAAPLLAFRIGAAGAARLLLTGQLIGAEQAREWGIFQQLVAYDQLWAQAHEMAVQIAAAAPESLQLTKRLLNETVGQALTSQLTAGAAASATARTTEAATEGVNAFLEKRDPQWP